MTYSHLFMLLRESGLSPEQLGERLGLAGMTLRRWLQKDKKQELPEMYHRALVSTVLQLVTEGILSPASEIAKIASQQTSQNSFRMALNNLGYTSDFIQSADPSQENLVAGLSQIGISPQRRESVSRNKKKILSFKKFGEEWKRRISMLLKVISSKELSVFDKMVAYGALFYLITVFDLIPDTIPGFGYLDDFALLGAAVVYYVARYPQFEKNV